MTTTRMRVRMAVRAIAIIAAMVVIFAANGITRAAAPQPVASQPAARQPPAPPRVDAPLLRWTPQTSGVTTRLRGVSAVSEDVAWASGARGTILRTTDGGKTWHTLTIPSTSTLDFRDVDAIDARVAYVLSIGPGDASRIYKTTDGGANWTSQFVNQDPKAFFDAMTFWDASRGIAISDSVDGRFVILMTADGGRTWTRAPAEELPPALENEGAFAASGSNIAVLRPDRAWIATGAASRARVLRSADRGRTWAISDSPLPSGPSSGIFSIAFRDAIHGIIVGGDYKNEAGATDNLAMTTDGGISWTLVHPNGLTGFRSAVAYLAPVQRKQPVLLAVGPAGSDYSTDDGRTWRAMEGPGFDAFSGARGGRTGWAVGAQGRIARLDGLERASH